MKFVKTTCGSEVFLSLMISAHTVSHQVCYIATE